MSAEELLVLISDGLKNPLSIEDIFSPEIKVSYLKRIDKVFNKGLHYYLDPKSPDTSRDASIFFRKTQFGVDLNIGARKIVNQFEEFKISLSALSKLAEIRIDRKLPVFTVLDDPGKVAGTIRKVLYPEFHPDLKEFLKALIAKCAESNIFVFEFVETWNKKEKANIDGFYLKPNVIVLKRQQASFRREIFTLVHELGHYLINEEEIDHLDVLNLANTKMSAIEKWCNDFAYYFLIGDYDKVLESIDNADSSTDYHFDLTERISRSTHLSQIALFTRLLYKRKITQVNYNKIKAEADEKYRIRQEELKTQREENKALGIQQGGSVPKPINSPLLVSTIQTAFYEGLLNEYDVCKALNISPDKLEKYIP